MLPLVTVIATVATVVDEAVVAVVADVEGGGEVGIVVAVRAISKVTRSEVVTYEGQRQA